MIVNQFFRLPWCHIPRYSGQVCQGHCYHREPAAPRRLPSDGPLWRHPKVSTDIKYEIYCRPTTIELYVNDSTPPRSFSSSNSIFISWLMLLEPIPFPRPLKSNKIYKTYLDVVKNYLIMNPNHGGPGRDLLVQKFYPKPPNFDDAPYQIDREPGKHRDSLAPISETVLKTGSNDKRVLRQESVYNSGRLPLEPNMSKSESLLKHLIELKDTDYGRPQKPRKVPLYFIFYILRLLIIFLRCLRESPTRSSPRRGR